MFIILSFVVSYMEEFSMSNLDMENALNIWQKTLEHLKTEIDDISYNDLFSKTKKFLKLKIVQSGLSLIVL